MSFFEEKLTFERSFGLKQFTERHRKLYLQNFFLTTYISNTVPYFMTMFYLN